MWSDLISTRNSYFPHLANHLTGLAIDLRYNPTIEPPSALRVTLCKLISIARASDEPWLFSFYGPLLPGRNFSVLDFLSRHELEIRLATTGMIKDELHHSMPSVELSFQCSQIVLEQLLLGSYLDFNYDLAFAGWLISDSKTVAMLNKWKFVDGFPVPDDVIRLSFCSSEDWDCVQFFSRQQDRMTDIATAASQYLQTFPNSDTY